MHAHSSARPEVGPISRIAGIGLVVALVVAPLDYASTRPTPLDVLSWGLHGIAAVWLVALLFEKRRPNIVGAVLWPVVALIVYCWLRYTLFAPGGISPFTQSHFSRIYDRWPESVILRTPSRITLLTSGLLASLLVACDLARRTVWRRAILFSMAGTGAAIAVLGLVENATHASGIFWETPKHNMPSPFFGTFYHFTSAGAFLNLTWPIAASMALYAFKRHIHEGKPVFSVVAWTGLATTILLGHLGHVSRFPQVIAAGTLVVLFLIHRPFSGMTWTKGRALTISAALIVAALGAFWVVQRSGRVGDIASRWRMLNVMGDGREVTLPPARAAWPSLMRDDLVVPYDHSHTFLGDRGAAYRFAWEAFTIQPIFGYGPGGWISAVSQHTKDPTIGTFYHYLQFTHDDFLQVLVEWGLVGALFWGWIVISAVRTAMRRVRHDAKRPSNRPEVRPLIIGALAALFAVWVQALIDFPLQIPANALYACILLAVCWSSAPLAASTKKHAHEQQSARL